jgi:F-type H+-transporting ATPase subunit epsilon
MAKKFRVEIVTPEKVVFSEEAESLIVPAERGYLGVLAGHAPLLASLQPGEILIRRPQGDLHFATSGGFMEVTPAKASLLTESAEEVGRIDVARAEEAVKRAQERLASHDKGVDADRARASLDRARNRLRLASKYKK